MYGSPYIFEKNEILLEQIRVVQGVLKRRVCQWKLVGNTGAQRTRVEKIVQNPKFISVRDGLRSPVPWHVAQPFIQMRILKAVSKVHRHKFRVLWDHFQQNR